jgi:hypothetical protein
MKRDEIIARVSGGETVFVDGGGTDTSFSVGKRRREAVHIRADQFGYLLDAGLISEARKERGQPWYQTRWKRAAKRKRAAKAPKAPPPVFGVGGGWDPYFFKGRLP